MNTTQNNIMLTHTKRYSLIYKFISILILMASCTIVYASNLAISDITFTKLASEQLQIQHRLQQHNCIEQQKNVQIHQFH